MEQNIDSILSRIDDWKGRNIRYEPLGGGITNHNYTVYVDGTPYVLRVPGTGTDLFIDRENELACSMEAGKTGVSPKLLYHLKPEYISVVQYINGRTLKTSEIASSDTLIKRIVRSIRVIHENAVFEKPFDPFGTVRRYLGFVEKYDAPLPGDIDRMLTLSERIESALAAGRPPNVACHNDYLSENFLDDGEKIWIIDWEYGGMGDPYFDLGDFAVEHPFSGEQEKLIIEEYIGSAGLAHGAAAVAGAPEAGLHRMLLYKIVSDLWWGIWAMIQHRISNINFDFHAYGTARFDRLRRNAGDPDFEKWIRGV
jgi:thiamine kinase-like enzyme